VQIEEFGGPDAIRVVELPDPEPAEGEAIVRVARAGVNFADTHATQNDYIAEQTLPLVPGMEVSGVTGDGRRVAAILPSGGYAELVAVPERWLVPVPDEVGDDVAAALLLQGLTAHSLIHLCGRVAAGDTVVVEAAAGGTGTLSVQLAKRAGARVIGMASSEQKRDLVRRLGADEAIDSRTDRLADELRGANGGEPVDVILHMSGEGFADQLRALAPFGRMVVFGNASRTPNEVATNGLLRHSTAVIGFWLVHLIALRRDLVVEGIADLLASAASGELEVVVGDVYPLSEAPSAHRELVARRTTGKLLLDPRA
jgi:NADPH2:quinone reductase